MGWFDCGVGEALVSEYGLLMMPLVMGWLVVVSLVTRGGVRSLSKSSMMPMVSVDRCDRSMTVSSDCANRSSARIRRARDKKLRPAGVSCMGLRP